MAQIRMCTLANALTQAPMLYCGERIGHSSLMPKIDIAVDPLDGTTLTAQVRGPLRLRPV